jgi:hypothetical protein
MYFTAVSSRDAVVGRDVEVTAPRFDSDRQM